MDGFDESDQKPTRQKTSNSKKSAKTETSKQQNVRFKLGGTIGVGFDDMNKDLRGAKTAPND